MRIFAFEHRLGQARFALAVVSIDVVVCSSEAVLQTFASPAEQAIARQYIDELRASDFVNIEKSAGVSIAGDHLNGALGQMADLIRRPIKSLPTFSRSPSQTSR